MIDQFFSLMGGVLTLAMVAVVVINFQGVASILNSWFTGFSNVIGTAQHG